MTAIINPLGEIEKKIDYNKDGFIDFETLIQLYFLYMETKYLSY